MAVNFRLGIGNIWHFSNQTKPRYRLIRPHGMQNPFQRTKFDLGRYSTAPHPRKLNATRQDQGHIQPINCGVKPPQPITPQNELLRKLRNYLESMVLLLLAAVVVNQLQPQRTLLRRPHRTPIRKHNLQGLIGRNNRIFPRRRKFCINKTVRCTAVNKSRKHLALHNNLQLKQTHRIIKQRRHTT
ncbi:MAG: hypothetical protein AAGJ35_09740 [Myxococcota bacterium]